MSVQGTCKRMTSQEARSWFENQDWYSNETYKTMISTPQGGTKEVTLTPVKIDEYREVCKNQTWNGNVYFKNPSGKIVEIVQFVFDAILPPMRKIFQKGADIRPISFVFPLGNRSMMINSSVQAIFPIIKFYAQIAHGHPMIIDSVEPPPQGVVSDARIQGFYSNPDDSSEIDFRYGDLTLLPFKESEKLKDWDGKPVFIENGKMVRPHVAVMGGIKIILKRKDDLVPRLGISVDAYPNGASVFPKEVVEGASSSSERIQMIPLFNEKLIEGSSVNLTEEKKEAP